MDQQTGSAAIETYLQEQGYSNLKLNQHWRHLLGTGEKNGTTYFIKMAATKLISPFTKNEASWNREISKVTQPLSFSVPQIFEDGEFEERYWFSAEHIEGPALARPEQKEDTVKLEASLGKIAQISKDIMTLPSLALIDNTVPTEEMFVAKIAAWEKEITHDISKLKSFMQERRASVKLLPAQGDFVPEHLLETNGKFYVTDNEHATNQTLAFYDVAYFYHRVYTKFQRPDVAEKFLQEFRKIHPLEEEDKQRFELALAQRTIGGYLDAQTDNMTSVELQEELENKLLNHQLLP